MDWQGLSTAYLDRERTRLGLPSREELAMKRAAEARAAAASESGLASADVARQRTQAEIAAMPGERALRDELIRSQITRNEREPQERALTGPAALLSLTPEQQKAYIDFEARLAKAKGDAGGQPIDRAAWQPQYDAGGNLLGFMHTGTFHSKEALGVPAGARRPLAAGTVSELSLLDNPARLPGLFRDSLAAVREAEKEHPVAAGTGIAMGNVGNVYRRVDTSGPGGDFDAARKQVRQVVYGLSGKQLNQSELQWLDSITPNLADPGVDAQINRFDAFVTALIEAKRQGVQDPFSAARLGFGIQRGPGAAAAPAAAGGGQVRVQRNKTTGETRHSLDGGATWQPGPPPQ